MKDSDTPNDDYELEADPELESGADTIKKLREKLKETESEKQEYLAGWQRAKADLVNASKRHNDERLETIKNATSGFIEELIPIIDSFDMAFANKEAWEKVDKNWRTGVEHIYNQILNLLKEHDVVQSNPTGEHFDPNKHQSLSTTPVDSPEKDSIIVTVVQKGYERQQRVIRPAAVIVGEYTQP